MLAEKGWLLLFLGEMVLDFFARPYDTVDVVSGESERLPFTFSL